MKKIAVTILFFMMLCSVSYAEIDFSTYSYDQLVELNQQLQQEIIKRPEWHGYSSDFDTAMSSLELLTTSADVVTKYNLILWEKAGSETLTAIKWFLTAGQYGSIYYVDGKDVSYGTAKEIDGIIKENKLHEWSSFFYKNFPKDYEKNEAHDYYVCYSFLSRTEEIKDLIKELKKSYPDHPDAIQALQNYYIKVAAYAEFAMHPSGTYADYNARKKTFGNEIQELRIYADFEK